MTWQRRQTYKHMFMTSSHHLMNAYTLFLFFAAFWASAAGVNGNRRVLEMDVCCNLSPLSDTPAKASDRMWVGLLCPGNLQHILTSWSVGSTPYLRSRHRVSYKIHWGWLNNVKHLCYYLEHSCVNDKFTFFSYSLNERSQSMQKVWLQR